MGQSVLAVLVVVGALRDSLDGRYAFRPSAHGGLRGGVGLFQHRVLFFGAIDHRIQRAKLKTGTRRRPRSESQAVAINLYTGDSAGFRAPVDRSHAVRCECNDVVHTRPAHRIDCVGEPQKPSPCSSGILGYNSFLLLPILLAASLLPVQQTSMKCVDTGAEIAAAQTQPLAGPGGASAQLKVSTADDHSKNSHECNAE